MKVKVSLVGCGSCKGQLLYRMGCACWSSLMQGTSLSHWGVDFTIMLLSLMKETALSAKAGESGKLEVADVIDMRVN